MSKYNSQTATLAFRYRGWFLGCVALTVLACSQPTTRSFLLGLPCLTLGLAARSWAFVYLGSTGRTRDPAPPSERVVGGPYRWFNHPVYLANVCVALGIVLAASPGPAFSVCVALLVVGFYRLLALREEGLLVGLPARASRSIHSVAALARCERSSWMTLSLVVLALMVRAL